MQFRRLAIWPLSCTMLQKPITKEGTKDVHWHQIDVFANFRTRHMQTFAYYTAPLML